MTIKIPALLTVLLSSLLLAANAVSSQTDAPVTARLTFCRTSYTLDTDPVDVRIILANTSGVDILLQGGFTEEWYHLHLFFQGPEPDSPIVTAKVRGTEVLPTPQVPPPGLTADLLKAGWLIHMDIEDARAYYPLTEPGPYKVWFEMPYVQYEYDPIKATGDDTDGDGMLDRTIVPFDAPPLSYGTIKSAAAYMTLAPAIAPVTADIGVMATEYAFGDGSHPGVTKKPLTGLQVRLYRKSEVAAKGISPINHTTYGAIISNSLIPYKLGGKTGIPGEYRFNGVEMDDYVVLACPDNPTGYKNLGKSVGMDDPGWISGGISTNLILMTDKKNKKAPGKSKKVTGSELIIIEPEYVEWTSDAELYPFAFESIGDWGVAVSVEPPEGFVTDYKTLTDTVSSELESLQFTITDAGSKWKPTKVKYKLEHKGKTKHIESEVGVKLSKKLSKEKKVGEWGEE